MNTLDQAAWKATDRVREAGVDLYAIHCVGWITLETVNGIDVIFVVEQDGKHFAGYRVVFPTPDSKGILSKLPAGIALTPDQETQWKVRHLAITSFKPKEQCSETYNPIVLRDPERGDWLVYMMSATSQPDLMIAGGHYRFSISKDAKTIYSIEPMSASCLNLKSPPNGEGNRPTAVWMTNLIFDVATEVHVFLNLSYRVPVYVKTTTKAWSISDGKITSIKQD